MPNDQIEQFPWNSWKNSRGTPGEIHVEILKEFPGIFWRISKGASWGILVELLENLPRKSWRNFRGIRNREFLDPWIPVSGNWDEIPGKLLEKLSGISLRIGRGTPGRIPVKLLEKRQGTSGAIPEELLEELMSNCWRSYRGTSRESSRKSWWRFWRTTQGTPGGIKKRRNSRSTAANILEGILQDFPRNSWRNSQGTSVKILWRIPEGIPM